MDRPTITGEISGVVSTVVGRVTHKVGVVVQCSLIDGEELMTLNPTVVRTLQFRIGAYLSITDGFLHAGLVVGTTEGVP